MLLLPRRYLFSSKNEKIILRLFQKKKNRSDDSCFSHQKYRGYEDVLRHTLTFANENPEDSAFAKVDHLALQNHDFDEKASRYLSAMLENPESHLRDLSIIRCNLTDRGVKRLCEAAAKNTSLKHLSLVEVGAGRAAAPAINAILASGNLETACVGERDGHSR